MREALLGPLRTPQIQLGNSALAGRLPGEVKYYDYPGAPLVRSYLSGAREMQPAPYGFSSLELNDADGGWAGSVIDLAKLVAMLDGARPRAPLSTGTFASMVAETPRKTWVDAVGWYGIGLFVTPQMGGLTWSHGGSLPGTRSYFWRFANGTSYGFLFNGDSKDQSSLTSYAAQSVWDALAAVAEADWPKHDLFARYYPPRLASPAVVNAASVQPGVLAAGSLITIFGADLGGRDADVEVTLRDGSGAETPLPILYSGPGQVNGVLPGASVPGNATLTVRRVGWPEAAASVVTGAIGPGVFMLNGGGLVAANLVRSKPGQPPSWEPVYQIDEAGNLAAKPVEFGGEGEELYLVIYCTGVRGRDPGRGVSVQIGSLKLPADYAGPQLEYDGLDQINVKLPRSLIGAGDAILTAEVDGMPSNPVSVRFR